MLIDKKCGPVHKVEKVEMKRRDACVVRVTFYSLMRPTSSSLHWGETINIDASIYFLSWGICIHMSSLYIALNAMCGVAYDKNGCGSNPLHSLKAKFSFKKDIDVNG